MARSIYAMACVLALAAASNAEALQVTNRDAKDYKLVVTEKGASKDMEVKASQVLDGFCNAGCTIKMADGEEYEFDGNEMVSIEEGLMFLDEPSDAGAPDTGNSEPGNPDGGNKKE